jgi:hypothetical protein
MEKFMLHILQTVKTTINQGDSYAGGIPYPQSVEYENGITCIIITGIL